MYVKLPPQKVPQNYDAYMMEYDFHIYIFIFFTHIIVSINLIMFLN